MEEKLGIENLTKFLKNIFKVAMTGFKVFQDGKIKGMEYLDLGMAGVDLFKAVKLAPVAFAEWKDVDPQEKEKLDIEIKGEFDIPNDVLEEKIEKILGHLIGLGDNFQGIVEAIGKAA